MNAVIWFQTWQSVTLLLLRGQILFFSPALLLWDHLRCYNTHSNLFLCWRVLASYAGNPNTASQAPLGPWWSPLYFVGAQTCSEQGDTHVLRRGQPPGRRLLNCIYLHMVQAAPHPGRCGCAAPTTPAAFPVRALRPGPVRGQAGALRTLQRVSDI